MAYKNKAYHEKKFVEQILDVVESKECMKQTKGIKLIIALI